MKQAMGIILTGRRVTAQEGQQLGFVTETVAVGESLNAARKWAEQILACSPMSIRASKDLVHRGLDCDSLQQAYTIQKTFTDVKTRSTEHTSELQALMRISYAILCM